MPPLTDFLQILHCTSPFSSDAIASIKKKISRKLYKPKCKSSTDLAITWMRILSKMKTFLSHFGIYIWHLRFLHPPVIWTLRQVNCPQVIQGSGSDLQTLAELTLCQQVWLAGRELDSQLSKFISAVRPNKVNSHTVLNNLLFKNFVLLMWLST